MQEAQHKGRDRFSFKPRCAHWFASNHIPKTRDTSSGFNRRWLILTFNRPVPLEKRILNIAEAIVAEEREAIVAWAIGALPQLVARREYTLPASHGERIQELAGQNNSVYFFLAQSGRVQAGPKTLGDVSGARISADELFLEYESFCRRAGFARGVGRAKFLMGMRELSLEAGSSFSMVKEEASKITGIDKWWFDGITLAA